MKKAFCLLKHVFLVVFTAFFFGFFFIDYSFAVTVSLSDIPSTITTDPFTLTASVSGAQAGTNYLKIDLFKDSSQNYFGETNTPQGWYSGSDYTQTYPITIVTNTPWSGQIQGKLGTPSITQYDGTGTYKLRVRRFTAGGSYIASDAFTITISVPTQTPTPTTTPTPSNTPTPTRTPTPEPTKETSVISTPTPTGSKKIPSPTQVLGESTQSASVDTINKKESPIPTQVEKKTLVASAQDNLIPFSIIGLGVLILASYGILLSYPRLKKLWKNE